MKIKDYSVEDLIENARQVVENERGNDTQHSQRTTGIDATYLKLIDIIDNDIKKNSKGVYMHEGLSVHHQDLIEFKKSLRTLEFSEGGTISYSNAWDFLYGIKGIFDRSLDEQIRVLSFSFDADLLEEQKKAPIKEWREEDPGNSFAPSYSSSYDDIDLKEDSKAIVGGLSMLATAALPTILKITAALGATTAVANSEPIIQGTLSAMGTSITTLSVAAVAVAAVAVGGLALTKGVKSIEKWFSDNNIEDFETDDGISFEEQITEEILANLESQKNVEHLKTSKIYNKRK